MVSQEHPGYIFFVPQPGLPWGSNSQEERSVRVERAGGSPATLRRFPQCSHLATYGYLMEIPYFRLFNGNP